jgi:hypothetical protein
MEADQDQLAAHPRHRSHALQGRLGSGALEGDVGEHATGQLGDDRRKVFLLDVDGARRAEFDRTVERISPPVGHDHLSRASQTDELLNQVAHESRPDQHDVVTEPDVGQLHGVDGAGEWLRKHGVERTITR